MLMIKFSKFIQDEDGTVINNSLNTQIQFTKI